MRNEVNSIVIQKFAKCLQTTLQVHDQAKFGFLLCKIFRGSQGTIFEETKNIQILKCNLRSYIFQLTLTTDYSAMQACIIILFIETQTHCVPLSPIWGCDNRHLPRGGHMMSHQGRWQPDHSSLASCHSHHPGRQSTNRSGDKKIWSDFVFTGLCLLTFESPVVRS